MTMRRLLVLFLPVLWTCSILTGPDHRDTPHFHSTSDVAGEFRALAESHPSIARVVPLGRSQEGREIWALKISAGVENDGREPAVLIVGGQHAREWLGVEIPVRLAGHLVTMYGVDEQVSALIDQGEVWIVPILNPDGHNYSHSEARNWRKNRSQNEDGTRGVDTNRNFSFAWGGVQASPEPSASIYRGPAPFSEPETRALRDLVLSRDFRAAVDYHSFSQSISVPANRTSMGRTADQMVSLIGAVHGKAYRVGSYEPPLLGGSFTDWANNAVGVDAYLIELRPGENQDSTEYPWLLERSAFDPPVSEILATWEEQRPALMHLLDTYLGAPASTAGSR